MFSVAPAVPPKQRPLCMCPAPKISYVVNKLFKEQPTRPCPAAWWHTRCRTARHRLATNPDASQALEHVSNVL